MNSDEEFPYPVSINRTDFRDFDRSKIDEFLYKNHRYTSLDSLISELSALSKDLNQTLLDLVNNDYHDFIRLGKSINDGLELINVISGDLNSFKSELVSHKYKLDASHSLVDNALTKREEMLYIKTLAKLNLVLNDQITSFENALLLEENKNQVLDREVTLRKLKTLTGLYLSISNLFTFLQSDPSSNEFIENFLKNKISSLKYEFRAYLDNLMSNIDQKDVENTDIVMMLLNIYKISGHSVVGGKSK